MSDSSGISISLLSLVHFNIKMYLKSEEKVSKLEAEIVKLKTRLADSELRFVGASSKVRSAALKLATDQIAEQEPSALDAKLVMRLVKKLGCNFQIFFSPFIELSDFSAPRPNFKPYDLKRYVVPGNPALGLTADLYECIPEKYHNILLSPSSELYSEKYTKAVS